MLSGPAVIWAAAVIWVAGALMLLTSSFISGADEEPDSSRLFDRSVLVSTNTEPFEAPPEGGIIPEKLDETT